VNASVAMMDRMSAEEALEQVRRVGIGTGSYEKDAASRVLAAWTRTVTGARAPRPPKPTVHELRTMGIGVRKQKRQRT
jgi:hypothetical protein